MSYQQTSNEINIIVSNNKFKTVAKQPDLTGTITHPDGKEMEVSLWKKIADDGRECLSGYVQDKWVKPEGYVSKAQPRSQENQNRVKIDF